MSTSDFESLAPAVEAEIMRRGGQVKGTQIWFPCPSPDHDDHHPSAAYNPRWLVYACESRGCHERHGGGGILALAKLLGVSTEGVVSPGANEEWRQAAVSSYHAERAARVHETHAWWKANDGVALLGSSRRASMFLGLRGISPEVAGAHRLGWHVEAGRQGLQIPYLLHGEAWAVQWRYDDDGPVRYRFRKGSEPVVWNMPAIEAGRGCLIVEGAVKGLVLESNGVERVAAIPAKSFAPRLVKWLESRGSNASDAWRGHIVWLDPDAASEAEVLARSIGAVMVVSDYKVDDILANSGWDPASLVPYIRAARVPG